MKNKDTNENSWPKKVISFLYLKGPLEFLPFVPPYLRGPLFLLVTKSVKNFRVLKYQNMTYIDGDMLMSINGSETL